MLIEERLSKIKSILEQQKSASLEALAEELAVSKDTIRRDLIKLEQKNIVKRIHGGAMLISRDALIFDYQERSSRDQQLKNQMGRLAAEQIANNSSLILDSSTTVEATIPYLEGKGLLAITNSLTHATLLAQLDNNEISILPGKLHKQQLFIYGAETVQKISEYSVDYTLLGVFAINSEGMFIHTEEEGLVKRQMIRQSKKVIALADHTKLGTTGLFKICGLSEIDVLVTDQAPATEFITALAENNVELIIP
ncbi:DeoR/GlpR family DNA-binding transcription regulator [Candidatus Enterococcus ferrettii]|uniref:DeoR family transcriptional regulator, carbon catabolite repression regulator n=1 Tax=Candidatus Enterococcus ferrettii TaxID=2815324 RepID=A0ABV0EKV4_9ENTE|nr:DeoR/GlpR family DNA-binding transcription regulator [Enterococcus sp. 665A]MBO1338968.1 DeoR/GlpR transcriptional regulator [Enterococcus sp. 665A]